MSIADELRDFILSEQRNKWIEADDVRAYVRRSRRMLGDKARSTLELANVRVGDGRKMKTGKLLPLFQAMEQQDTYDYLYCENADAPRMSDILDRNGWTFIPNPLVPPHMFRCYYKRLR